MPRRPANATALGCLQARQHTLHQPLHGPRVGPARHASFLAATRRGCERHRRARSGRWPNRRATRCGGARRPRFPAPPCQKHAWTPTVVRPGLVDCSTAPIDRSECPCAATIHTHTHTRARCGHGAGHPTTTTAAAATNITTKPIQLLPPRRADANSHFADAELLTSVAPLPPPQPQPQPPRNMWRPGHRPESSNGLPDTNTSTVHELLPQLSPGRMGDAHGAVKLPRIPGVQITSADQARTSYVALAACSCSTPSYLPARAGHARARSRARKVTRTQGPAHARARAHTTHVAHRPAPCALRVPCLRRSWWLAGARSSQSRGSTTPSP